MEVTNTPAPKQSVLVGWIGAILVRLIVPVWILFGAISKVTGATPKSLPRSILDAGGFVGFQDHYLLLALLTAIEFFFIGFMFFIPLLARRAAMIMLGIFLVVLCVEMFVYDNYESCGCLGEKSLATTTMFAIDFALLLGVVTLKPRVSRYAPNRKNRETIEVLISLIIVAWCCTFYFIMGAKPILQNNSDDHTIALPASWYPRDLSTWMGKSVEDIPLFSWVEWPSDITDGQQYVVFYARTCDHCEELLNNHFEFDLRTPTTLVAIPESNEGFFEEGTFENPCLACNETELPIGVEWIIGAPMVVAIENGIVKCAIENEEIEVPACLIW